MTNTASHPTASYEVKELIQRCEAKLPLTYPKGCYGSRPSR